MYCANRAKMNKTTWAMPYSLLSLVRKIKKSSCNISEYIKDRDLVTFFFVPAQCFIYDRSLVYYIKEATETQKKGQLILSGDIKERFLKEATIRLQLKRYLELHLVKKR